MTPDRRRADLAKIHIAKKQLRLDDDTYRAMLWTVARVNSSSELDDYGRQRVLEHLRNCGFKAARSPGKTFPGRPPNVDVNPQLRKVEALLADAGRPWEYADAMAKRMFHVDRAGWCNPDQLQRLIAALEFDRRRRKGSEPTRGGAR